MHLRYISRVIRNSFFAVRDIWSKVCMCVYIAWRICIHTSRHTEQPFCSSWHSTEGGTSFYLFIYDNMHLHYISRFIRNNFFAVRDIWLKAVQVCQCVYILLELTISFLQQRVFVCFADIVSVFLAWLCGDFFWFYRPCFGYRQKKNSTQSNAWLWLVSRVDAHLLHFWGNLKKKQTISFLGFTCFVLDTDEKKRTKSNACHALLFDIFWWRESWTLSFFWLTRLFFGLNLLSNLISL